MPDGTGEERLTVHKSTAAIDAFADHVAASTFEALSDIEIGKAKTFLLDSIGVGIAGSGGASMDALRAIVSSWGAGDEATVWVTGERLPAQQAAIINSYQIHCLEFDCVHEGAVVHPMATVLSAMMAHAERRALAGAPVNGRDFLAALCAGIDVATLIGVAATGPVRFFRPATAGGLGAAAALARMEGLDATGVKNAIGATYSQTSGTLQAHAEGSMLLGLQIGFNARAALCALDLAKADIRAPHDVIDGQYGYLQLIENGDFDLAPALEALGQPSQITQLAHKPFPSGRLTHGVVDALAQVMGERGIGADDIAGVHCRVPPLVYRLVGRPDMLEPEANYAKLCLRFIAGVYLARGRVDVPDFKSADMLNDPEVHRQATKIEVELDENPDPNALDPQSFTFTFADGSTHAMTLDHVVGHPKRPLTEVQNEDKFRRCVGYGRQPMKAGAADALVETIARLEDIDDVSVLAAMTVGDSAGGA